LSHHSGSFDDRAGESFGGRGRAPHLETGPPGGGVDFLPTQSQRTSHLLPPQARRTHCRGRECISFVTRSANTPGDIFVRDGLFAANSSRFSSHPLSAAELGKLSKTIGYMPRVAQLPGSSSPHTKVQEHLASLDDQLRDRVQGICDRFNESQGARGGLAGRCRWLTAVGTYFRLGVLREIWMEIAFYFLYSLWLQWYAHSYDWEFQWSADNQDTIYYPALVMSFLLSFRASDCMARYQTGCRCIFKMEKQLREIAFDVLTKFSTGEGGTAEGGAAGLAATACEGGGGAGRDPEAFALRQRYFKHEFRRLTQVLFVCAARDLNDSAGDGGGEGEENDMRLRCSLTDVEKAAIHVTHSSHGHIFRVYIVAAWLNKLVRTAEDYRLFDDSTVSSRVEDNLSEFKTAWMKARHVAYSSMPDNVTHLLWVLASAINFVLPWEYVAICKYWTWLPSLFISVSFFGIVHIASHMENPFGSDDDDIPVWDIAEHLDEEVSLIMFYAALDEVGGENLYRGLAAQDHIYVK